MEMSRSAGNALGLAVASTVAFVVAEAVGSRPIYDSLVEQMERR